MPGIVKDLIYVFKDSPFFLPLEGTLAIIPLFNLVAQIIVTSMAPSSENISKQFNAHWRSSTADNNSTLHGFRRFKTTHLLNLRFLESEIAELDHIIYQAGLSSNQKLSPKDRLGLRHAKRDGKPAEMSKAIDRELILKLRELLRQYGPYQYRVTLFHLTSS